MITLILLAYLACGLIAVLLLVVPDWNESLNQAMVGYEVAYGSLTNEERKQKRTEVLAGMVMCAGGLTLTWPFFLYLHTVKAFAPKKDSSDA